MSIGWLVVVIFVSIKLDGYKERQVWLFIQIKLIVFDSLAIWNIEKSNDSFCSRRGHKDIHTEKLCILTSRIEISVKSEAYSFYYVLRILLRYAASPSPFKASPKRDGWHVALWCEMSADSDRDKYDITALFSTFCSCCGFSLILINRLDILSIQLGD